MNVAYLNVFGLILTTCAAFLMWLYPLRRGDYTEKGEPIYFFTGDPSPGNVSKGKWRAHMSRIAPVMLMIGFALQLPAAWLSAWPIK